MQMEVANRADLDTLYSIILDRSGWLKEKGIPQWNPVYPRTRFENELQQGYIYLFKDEDRLIGTATLLEDRPSYYPSDVWNDVEDVWYVCRLATFTQYAGKGYGNRMLASIEEEARRRNKRALRLDVVQANPFLRSYYERHDFVVIKEADSHGTPSLFMEKNLRKAKVD